MEEAVGQYWDKWITRLADNRHSQAQVSLEQMRKVLGIYFRALGGDAGLSLSAATPTRYQQRRNWLQRLAGSHTRVELAWRDGNTLHLPAQLALFAEADLNRQLYFWLAALACAPALPGHWYQRSQAQVNWVLVHFPGLVNSYAQLVQAHLAQRPAPATLPSLEAEQERLLRQALTQPGSVSQLPHCRYQPHPVVLWLHPVPPLSALDTSQADAVQDGGQIPAGGPQQDSRAQKRQAERTEMPKDEGGLLALRHETSLFTLADFIKLDRRCEEDDDLSQAEQNADDSERLSIARDQDSLASRIRFDLDLPAAAVDARPLAGPISLPEWDYRQQRLLPNQCLLHTLAPLNCPAQPLPSHLQVLAKRLRRQFEALQNRRQWLRQQEDGSEIDLEAYLNFRGQLGTGHSQPSPKLYRQLHKQERDLACLLLADLSLSTDAWVGKESRIIDLIRDGLLLFSESLNRSGDAFALYGFSSRTREQVRFSCLKHFHEPYNAQIRGRIQAIEPGYYTRMGAAIRQSSQLLLEQDAQHRLLLILTDGKPNDLDHYEGRYGIEDTRMAIREARQAGLIPFCLTIDDRAEDYLPYLFGQGHYAHVRRPAQLPRALPKLYARLTASLGQ